MKFINREFLFNLADPIFTRVPSYLSQNMQRLWFEHTLEDQFRTLHFRFAILSSALVVHSPLFGSRPNEEIERRRIETDSHTSDLIKCRNFRRRGRKERKTFRFAARRRAQFLTCRAGKVDEKLKIRTIPPSTRKFSVGRRKWTRSRRCCSPHPSSTRLFHRFPSRVFYFPATHRFCPEHFLLVATRMLLFTICKYNFVGLNGSRVYISCKYPREMVSPVIGSPPPPPVPLTIPRARTFPSHAREINLAVIWKLRSTLLCI